MDCTVFCFIENLQTEVQRFDRLIGIIYSGCRIALSHYDTRKAVHVQ